MHDFREAMNKAGIITKDKIIVDGHIHRFQVYGDKPGQKNGWYVAYDGDIPAGAFGCWKRGIKGKWSSTSFMEMTDTQRDKYKAQMLDIKRSKEYEQIRIRREAKEKANYIWSNAIQASNNHPYLIKKNVKSYGLRQFKGQLVMPLHDETGVIHSLQFIDGDGNKRFLSGGRKKGCYFSIGVISDSFGICEGYATGASIHETCQLPVAVSMDKGNLSFVGKLLRKKFPDTRIVICADNDIKDDGNNPGFEAARQAAHEIHACVALPPYKGDFNDFINRNTNG
jgi:putative DNA primase/helicase